MWIRITLFCLLCPLVWAEDTVHYNRINITSSASGELANDTMIVQLMARAEDKQSRVAGSLVNKDMAWALELLKKYPDIRTQTLSYRTFPRHRDQKIVGWQVEQGLRLETTKISLLATVTGELQTRLKVRNMQYEASADKRREKENNLISEAIDAFEERALVVATSLGFQNHRIVNLRIDTQNQPQPYPRMEMMTRASSLSKQEAPAAIQAGTQTVSVVASGEIELVK